jgi:aerobic-type carbon monoxide dehydrogenase small subunit (CoxS/CutS family)
MEYQSDPDKSLLEYLRNDLKITSVKDGCSGEGVCGACTVEINGRAKMSCVTKMKKLDGADIITLEGFSPYIKDVIATSFVNKGAVQCGFCTPGLISKTKILLQNNPEPSLN